MKPNLIAAALASLALIAPCFAQETGAGEAALAGGPAPATAETPATEQTPAERPDLDLSELADMLRSGRAMRAPTVQERAGAMLRTHIRSCWEMPRDLAEAQPITVLVSLNEDGTLRRQPRVVSPANADIDRPTLSSIRSAFRAIRDCAPYPMATDPALASQYNSWRELELVFRAP
jgi:hypothetical protein